MLLLFVRAATEMIYFLKKAMCERNVCHLEKIVENFTLTLLPFQAGCGCCGNKVLPRRLMFAVKEIGSVFHEDALARVHRPDADSLMS